MANCKKAFSLVEVIAAVALFALAGFAVSQACYNIIAPLGMKDADGIENADLQLCLAEIMNVADYNALGDGIDVDGLDGQTYRVYAEFEPTEILDLFELKITIKSPRKDFEKTALVIRPKWYENASERDDLKKDRTDFLEQKRRLDHFNAK